MAVIKAIKIFFQKQKELGNTGFLICLLIFFVCGLLLPLSFLVGALLHVRSDSWIWLATWLVILTTLCGVIVFYRQPVKEERTMDDPIHWYLRLRSVAMIWLIFVAVLFAMGIYGYFTK